MIFSRAKIAAWVCAMLATAEGATFRKEESWTSAICDRETMACRTTPGRLEENPTALAEARFVNDVDSEGWGKIWVNTREVEGSEVWFAAGFLEGALTSDLVRDHFDSWFSVTFPAKTPLTTLTQDFIMENHRFATKLVEANARRKDPYFDTLAGVLAQTNGLLAGINYSAAPKRSFTLLEVLLLQAAGDLYDIIPATNTSAFELHIGKLSRRAFRNAWHKSVSCSSLIKMPDDAHDIYLGHTTWSTYENMLRIFKHYSIGQSNRVTFSSKPGLLYSKDDFYILPRQKLVVMETTNGIMNQEMYQRIKPSTLLTWHRIPLVNTLANTGQEWTSMFAQFNSGTYANQWIIVDMKRFQKTRGVEPGFLWISEVAPDLVESADVTDIFSQQGHFWPSMNVPFFKKVYNESGFQRAFEAYGDEYSYEKCPRHQIFSRDHHKVQDLSGIQKILRYNNFQNDPLSLGSPVNVISSRKDLDPKSPSAFGGIDTKVTSFSQVVSSTPCAQAQNGPTHDQQEPFRWSASRFASNVHLGQPDLFNFPFIDHCREAPSVAKIESIY